MHVEIQNIARLFVPFIKFINPSVKIFVVLIHSISLHSVEERQWKYDKGDFEGEHFPSFIPKNSCE